MAHHHPLTALPRLLLFLLLSHAVIVVRSATDPSDVDALGVLYNSLFSPSQLTGWTSGGGDPCGESWKGVSCSGTAVTDIQISGLGLNGTLGYLLSDLLSLKTMDVSNNNLGEAIPYQLPPNLTYLNIANNNLSGNLPYSISSMVALSYLNVSHNFLTQPLGDIFSNLQNLSDLDLSFNNLTGDLPNSISSLSNLSSLYLQENQFTGPVNLLRNLYLTNLNIAKNNFSGWIPQEFSSIPNLIIEGNSFVNGPAPPPPPYMPPPPNRPPRDHNHTLVPANPAQGSSGQNSHSDNSSKKKSSTVGSIIGITIGSILGVFLATLGIIFCLSSFFKGKDDTKNDARNSVGSLPTGADNAFVVVNNEMQEQKLKSVSVANLKPQTTEKIMNEKLYGKNGSVKRPKVPITATSYTVASLQIATNSFSQEYLVGEGSLGRVYRAEFPNGKVLAVKKIDSAALSLQEEDNYLEAVSNMSRLRHSNITTLLGYCVEHGQHLLVYEYIGNGTLHDMLHFSDDVGKALTWNARVRVALDTARALEYLHEVCLPPVVHRNFKSANILLDEDPNPHLSDCGIAAMAPNTERQVSAEMIGSFGYSASEFAMSGVYTVKNDVYSFGVVMLELLTGRKPLDSSRERSERSLVRWATPQLQDIDALAKMVDPALNGMYPAKSLSRLADVIALCVQVDLVGGYHDAGDNVKFGLPMAFTITMLSWGVIEYGDHLVAAGEYEHALEAIKWGTDYFIKAHPSPHVLWAEVGDGETDHYCWQRPEDMTTPRRAYKIDAQNPGSEIAGETAAAMAAAAIVFNQTDPHYSQLLIQHAQQLFEFGDKYRGRYDLSIGVVKGYYPSMSGYGDELLWAALWLHRATARHEYLEYVADNAYKLGGAGWAVAEFSWDIKYAGVQVLAAKLLTEEGELRPDRKHTDILKKYKSKAEHYLCSCLNKNSNTANVRRTPGGLLFVRKWNTMQHVAAAAFLLTAYSDELRGWNQSLHCPKGVATPDDLLALAKSQADYILGSNPRNLSYLVGFGPEYPKRVHHRAASMVSYKENREFIGCMQGYNGWYGRQKENPNVVVGAIVGGPGAGDEFEDRRGNYMQTEPCTYNTAPMVGVFARLMMHE